MPMPSKFAKSEDVDDTFRHYLPLNQLLTLDCREIQVSPCFKYCTTDASDQGSYHTQLLKLVTKKKKRKKKLLDYSINERELLIQFRLSN